MSTDDEEYLEHVGILGMKWGHRKSSASTGPQYSLKREGNKTVAVTKSGRKVPADQQAKVKRKLYELKQKKINDITNKVIVISAVGGALAAVGAFALSKYTNKRFGPVPNAMGMKFDVEGPISAVGTIFDSKYRH